DRSGEAVETHGLANNVLRAGEEALPCAVRDHEHRGRVVIGVLIAEAGAALRGEAESAEQPGLDEHRFPDLRMFVTVDGVPRRQKRRETLERMLPFANIAHGAG